jgi:hypothetical protein
MFFGSVNEHVTNISFRFHEEVEEEKKMQVYNLSHRKVNLMNQED